MILSAPFTVQILANVALALYVVGFITRDELRLRTLVLMASLLLIAFNSLVPRGPFWIPIVHSSVIGTINLVLLVFVIRERSPLWMRPEMLALYRSFPTLNPGQFRRVMKVAEHPEFEDGAHLLAEGVRPDRLYLLVEGEVMVERDGATFTIGPGNFIGEDGPATATVTARGAPRCVAWRRRDLVRLMDRSPALANAVNALLNKDIARKLSVSSPAAMTA